jgi:predicted dehydrogenase
MSSDNSLDRRDFLRKASAVSVALGTAGAALASPKGAKSSSARSSGRVLGANDRITIGVIGVGGRGSGDANSFAAVGEKNNSCQIVAVADTYQKRVTANKERHKCDGYLDYREIINRKDIDAVVIATPKAIADGMIGKMIMSQGSYHRNSLEGEWNYKIDEAAGPEGKGEDFIDWKMWLGKAPARAWDPDRFFRFRKYWDYSGGIATDLFYHVVAPLNICWDKPQFPHKVTASGGIYGGPKFEYKREVPDTFHLMAEYAEGHSLVLSSSMANSQHIPGLIRGHEGTITMVDNGQFESTTDHITLKPEVSRRRGATRETPPTVTPMFEGYKFGVEEVKIPVEKTDTMATHINNFLTCMHTREKPHLPVETGACAQVLITMAVESYRQGKVLYFDEKKWKVSDKPVKA